MSRNVLEASMTLFKAALILGTSREMKVESAMEDFFGTTLKSFPSPFATFVVTNYNSNP